MHLATLLTLAASASTLATARFDRRSASHSHRQAARSHLPAVEKRATAAEQFRYFAASGEDVLVHSSFEGLDAVVGLKKRDETADLAAVIARIGDVVDQVAVAYKLSVPAASAEPAQLATDAQAAAQREQDLQAQRDEAAQRAALAAERKAKKLAAKKQAEADAKAKAERIAAEEADAAEADAAELKKQKLVAKKKAQAKAKAAAERQASEEAAAKAAADKAAADKAAAEKAAADKAAAEKIAAERKAAEAAAAQKEADKAAAKQAAQEKTLAVADTSSSSSNAKLAVFNPGKTRSLIGFKSDNCGPSGATADEPNGAQSWLNCGISKSNPGGGWTPPAGVTLDHITTVSLEQALASNHIWEPCRPFVKMFEQIAAENDLPPILLASFALQESTCNPNVLGDSGGAFGLLQITEDKCGGRSAKNCAEPWYNVRTGAKYFKDELANQGGEFLKALGAYNGWYTDLSYQGATAAAYSGCCECQQNLDYLYQMTNGWLLGRTGYELGSFKNLAVCKNQD